MNAAGKPLVDPICLCGQWHPCPVHGQWAHTPIYGAGFDAFTLLRLMAEADVTRAPLRAGWGPIQKGAAYTQPA